MQLKRFVLEGTWSGYHAGQRHIVHRVVTRNPAKYRDLSFITFADGTSLDLTLRECQPREKVKEIHGYRELIEKCLRYGVNSVDALLRTQ